MDKTEHGDEIEVDLERGEIKNLTKGFSANFKPIPPEVAQILKAGGLMNYAKDKLQKRGS